MEIVRDVKDLALEMKGQLARLLRARAIRDPLGDLSPELTGPQIHAIAALGIEPDGVPVSVLAQRTHCAVPSTTGLVDRLERDGLAERDRSSTDRRVVLVRLTAKGREVFNRLDEDATEKLTLLMTALSPDEREFLVSLMKKLAALAEASSSSSTPPSPSTPEESHEI